jgi:PAS domain S-box-containing protein
VSQSGRAIRAPELSELETLVVCATEGSLAGAAARLSISRPAVTKRIANLEALAGRALFHRGGRGIRLTDAGAALLADARRMLDERDRLLETIAEIRGDAPSHITGLRQLLGHSTAAARAAQLPEARLSETERVLELVLRASATGVSISDPDTLVFHEVNDAYCRILGRSRDELLGRSSIEVGIWHDASEGDRLRESLTQTGELERVVARLQRPDGTVRVVETTVRLITLGGKAQLVATVDDITEQSFAHAERDASESGYRALARIAALLLAGRPVPDCVGSALAELRENSGFALAVVWDLEHDRPHSFDGCEELRGLAVALPTTHSVLALLHDELPMRATREPFETMLADLVTLISARAAPGAAGIAGPAAAAG